MTIQEARAKGLPPRFLGDLDTVIGRHRHGLLRRKCDPESAEFQPWLVDDVRIRAARIRQEDPPDPWYPSEETPEERPGKEPHDKIPEIAIEPRTGMVEELRVSRTELIHSCDYRVPMPELSEIELHLLPLESCGCQSEVPSICLAGLSGRAGTPHMARDFDCLRCVSRRRDA